MAVTALLLLLSLSLQTHVRPIFFLLPSRSSFLERAGHFGASAAFSFRLCTPESEGQ
jgi:hypothetical protein